ncbi:MAG: acyl-CoA dehydrogenase family protein [Burkholderiales bacterium]|jgi:alkylation response protein AidB-like acyl-CoA dehydrogenase
MSLAFEPVELPEGARELRARVRDFLSAQREAGGYVPRCSGWTLFDADFSRACGRAGLIGLTWPKRWGGQERTTLERYVVVEELLAAGAPVGAHWIADRQSGPQILRHGSEALQAAVLPGIVRGEISFAIGMSEPDSGSDLASVRSRGARADGGWRLSGRKVWTTGGHRADYMIGLFRTEPLDTERRHAGLTQFVVDLKAPGVERRPIRNLCGRDDFSEITFDDVFVPDAHVLGRPGDGWRLVTGELAFERSGPERFLSVFPLLVELLRAGPRDDTPAARTELGRAVAHLAALRRMALSIAAKLDAGADPATEAAITKDLGNALEREIPERLRALRLAEPTSAAARAYRELLDDTVADATSYTLRGGTPEVLRGMIARGLGLR